nr:SUMF1/EgtB/PvdO family nonheme iron enzyme [Peptostreptococcus stomatis]
MDLTRYLKENMVLILEGQELIRDFVDPVKWLSSDYKMSIPGIKKEKIVKQELVMIQSFLLLKTPVTNELYNYVMETDYDIQTKNFPAVNISWIDAIKFCNLLSEKLSLEKCYTLNSASEKIIFDHSKNGFRLPKDEEWQYACRGNTEGYRYDNIEDIAWFEENSDGRLHEVRTKKKIILGFLI